MAVLSLAGDHSHHMTKAKLNNEVPDNICNLLPNILLMFLAMASVENVHYFNDALVL